MGKYISFLIQIQVLLFLIIISPCFGQSYLERFSDCKSKCILSCANGIEVDAPFDPNDLKNELDEDESPFRDIPETLDSPEDDSSYGDTPKPMTPPPIPKPCQFPTTKSKSALQQGSSNNGSKLGYKSCHDYQFGADFRPFHEITDPFLLPYTKRSICKATIEGREYLGFALHFYYDWTCVLHTNTHTIEVQKDFSILNKPITGVKWVWKNSNGTIESLSNAVKLIGTKTGNFSVVGIGYFQAHFFFKYEKGSGKEHDFKDHKWDGCPLTEEQYYYNWDKDVPEVSLVTGFISNLDPANMKFQFNREFYSTTDFQILTCKDT